MHTSSKPFDFVIGIVGHPTSLDLAWSDFQLQALKDAGFDTLQLSIAWSYRPANEVLNLENFEAENGHIAEWRRRIAQARRFGFRTLAHFGLPMGQIQDATTCILDPQVRDRYAARVSWFFREFPEVDAMMVYNYDQRAALCSEFGPCPRCHGVPLHERLPGFLELLIGAMQAVKAGVRLWWEPWELSEGQILAILDRIRPEHLGVVMHNSIAEVQLVNTTDLSFRNIARQCLRRGIPMIGEAFLGGSSEETEPRLCFPCPRLTYQQLHALRTCPGIVGVKEYYGLQPKDFSVNIEMVRRYLRSGDAPLEELLADIAGEYSPDKNALLEAWELASWGMELFPWNASWHMRQAFQKPLDHEWTEVPPGIWPTPSWNANRRGFYMVVDLPKQHPWLKEDVGLRATKAAEIWTKAADLLEQAARSPSPRQADLARQAADVRHVAAAAKNIGQGLSAHRADQ